MSVHLQRFRSRDVATVEKTWQQYVPSAVLRRADPHRFRFDWQAAQLDGLSVVRYELAAGVRSVVQPEGQILVCRVRGAGARVRAQDGRGLSGVPWITDGATVEAEWDGAATVEALIFDLARAEELARQISGDDALILSVREPAPRRPADGDLWATTFDHVLAALASPGSDDAILRASLERHALWTTLAAFDTTFRDTMEQTPQRRAAPAIVRRALAHIDEHASEPITVDDVAAAVHLSTRGLQLAFRRALDTTLAEALRRARLAGARGDLLASADTGETVTTIARRWGFSHPSRFARYFRDEYGVAPGELRRR